MLPYSPALIYILQVPTTQVKIGRSKNRQILEDRIITLQSLHYQKLTLIRTIESTHRCEIWFHNRYYKKGKHIRGQWFEFDEEMLTIIPPPPLELEKSLIKSVIYTNMKYREYNIINNIDSEKLVAEF